MISAIMPTFNQAEFLQQAIDSVVNEIDELIVVNDGSTDETSEILNANGWRTNMKVITLEENGGTAGAINSGFEHARGNWVTWVSSDNIYEAKWATRLSACGSTDEVGVIYSAYWNGSKERVNYTPYDHNKLISTVNCFFGPCFLIRWDVWKEAGPHRGKISHDYDHWLRVEEVCWRKGLKIVTHPEPLCFYRVHKKRATVVRRHEFDAPHWQAEAKKRRVIT